ncbi:MAG: thiamine pyrophosphate-binding protein [Actinobacteria bacterium]|nr:thiamine pyrophosphate-binding protein [Actinomycetota bacterium]
MADNSKDDFGTDLNSVEVPVEIPVDLGLPEFGSDAVVDLLGKLGYKFIAINPGSSFRGLHDSIVNHHGNKDPKLLLCLHEEVAVSLAHGYAKASTTPIAVAIHDLVGLMHASMAVYDTFVDRTALLILGGSGPRDRYKRRPIDWIHSADSQAQLIREFVKWDDEPSPSSAFVPSVMKAHQIAHSWPYGPTYVSLDCAHLISRRKKLTNKLNWTSIQPDTHLYLQLHQILL